MRCQVWEEMRVDRHIEQLLREAKKADSVDRERADAFASLVRHPGWVVYMEILEARIQMLADEVLAPAKSVDGMVTLEYVKGAMSGLIMARDIPSVTIAAKDEMRPVQENDDDDESV